ncbi:hypothetical protein ACH5RR_026312 [Cinchona calisaya]|uniref:Aspartyl-phosphate phosphatase Spo0E family protein n=1 Tax=Cinchona calisaya TaxID=153742 RepID=A0ABD2Z5I6_9GENT
MVVPQLGWRRGCMGRTSIEGKCTIVQRAMRERKRNRATLILLEEVETELKEAALISMGTGISDLDMMRIKDLYNQVLSFYDYRA